MAEYVNSLKSKQKNLMLVWALFPLAVPPLLPAYSYSAFSFNFQTAPVLNEILYCLTVLFKSLPIPFLLFFMLPEPISKSGNYCNDLLPNSSKSIRVLNKPILAFAASFLYIFHEYEMSSLMRVKHWTVVIFNAHAGGLILSLADTVKLATLPLLTSVGITLWGIKQLKGLKHPPSTTSKF